MFKLLKILNSGSNAPEPVRLPKSSGTLYNTEALVLHSGKLRSCESVECPDYISLGEFSGSEAVCYPVTEEMIFETELPTLAPGEETFPSDIFTLGFDAKNSTRILGESDGNGPVYILALENDKAIIRFIRW